MNTAPSLLLNRILLSVLAAAALALSGCATHAPSADFSAKIKDGSEVRLGDTAKVAVNAIDGVAILPVEKERLSQQIEAKVLSKAHDAKPAPQPRNFAIEVTLSQYEKGNAFARAMLAGLGQIHITGDVKVYLLPERTPIGEFTIKKTFAWGGIYGGITSMETVEEGFAEGVADAVTDNNDDDDPKSKKA